MGAVASFSQLQKVLASALLHEKSDSATPVRAHRVLSLVTSTLPHPLMAHAASDPGGQKLRGPEARTLRGILERYDRRLRDDAGIEEGIRTAVVGVLASRIGVRGDPLPSHVLSSWQGPDLLSELFGSPAPDRGRALTSTRWLRERFASAHESDFLIGYALTAAHAEGYPRWALVADSDRPTRLAVRAAVTSALTVSWGIDPARASQCLDAWDATLGLKDITRLEPDGSRPGFDDFIVDQLHVRNQSPSMPVVERIGSRIVGSTKNQSASSVVADAPAEEELDGYSAWVSPPKQLDVPKNLQRAPKRRKIAATAEAVPAPDAPAESVRMGPSEEAAAHAEGRASVRDDSSTWESAIPTPDVIPALPPPVAAAALAFLTFGHGYVMYWLWSTWKNVYHADDKPPSRILLTLASVIPIIGWGIILTRALRIERACAPKTNGFEGRALAQAALYTCFSIMILTDTLWIELSGLVCVSMMAALSSHTSVTAQGDSYTMANTSTYPRIFIVILGSIWITLITSHFALS